MVKLNRKIFNDNECYGWGSVILHWFTAVAVIGLYPLGLYIESLDYYDPAYRTVPMWHKSVGIVVALLLTLRLFWQLFNKPPAPLPQPKFLKVLANIAHKLLLLLLAVTLGSGFLISTADGSAISVFNWFQIPALPYAVENQEDIAGDIHFFVATGLITLAALHAIAGLKHHFVDKDRTLTRMLGIREDKNEK